MVKKGVINNKTIVLLACAVILVIAFVAVGFSIDRPISISGKASIAQCIDSDGGKNYIVKGITKGMLNGKYTNRTDFCKKNNYDKLERFLNGEDPKNILGE